jgi:hypothetical protein
MADTTSLYTPAELDQLSRPENRAKLSPEFNLQLDNIEARRKKLGHRPPGAEHVDFKMKGLRNLALAEHANDAASKAAADVVLNSYYKVDRGTPTAIGMVQAFGEQAKNWDNKTFLEKSAAQMEVAAGEDAEKIEAFNRKPKAEQDDDAKTAALDASPRYALAYYESQMTNQSLGLARRLSAIRDPQSAVSMIQDLPPDQQSAVIGWISNARPKLEAEDGYGRILKEKVGYMLGVQRQYAVGRAIMSMNEGRDIEIVNMSALADATEGAVARIEARQAGQRDWNMPGEGTSSVPLFQNGSWSSDEAREEMKKELMDAYVADRLAPRTGGQDFSAALPFDGDTSDVRENLRKELEPKVETMLDRMPAVWPLQQKFKRDIVAEYKTYNAFAPKINRETSTAAFHAAAIAEVATDVVLFAGAAAATAPIGGTGGAAYMAAITQSNLEADLLSKGVDLGNAKSIATIATLPIVLIERWQVDRLAPVKFKTAAAGAAGAATEAIAARTPTSAFGRFLQAAAITEPALIEAAEQGLKHKWAPMFAHNMRHAIKRNLKDAPVQVIQEWTQEGLEAASKSWAAEFADENELDHGVIWTAFQDSLLDIAISMGGLSIGKGATVDTGAAALAAIPGEMSFQGKPAAEAEVNKEHPLRRNEADMASFSATMEYVELVTV